jgi:gentisate 1,2-dioxygenase
MTIKANTQTEIDLTTDAMYHEYTSAVNPHLPSVPALLYSSQLHKEGNTRIIPFDLSEQLHCDSPATGPNVSASYLRICKGESLDTHVIASAQLFCVIRGEGSSQTEFGTIPWSEGDAFVLPAGERSVKHTAHKDSAIYFVNDAPLLHYLGVKPIRPLFNATLYPSSRILSELERVDSEPSAHNRNRDAIILGNSKVKEIKSASPTLWSAFVLVRPGEIQRPHKHNSIAVDIVIKAAPNCYTLLGSAVDEKGNIINPTRVDWESGAAFVTPPGLWHGHYNESSESCMVMAAQEAGFYEHMRTLDIRFTKAVAGSREYKD